MVRIGSQAYRVCFLEKYYCIYNVVLVSFLKLWTASHDLEKALFPDLKDD